MYCPRCGKDLGSNARFCGKCGYQLNESRIQESRNNKHIKVNMRTLVLFVSVIVGIAVFVVVINNKPDSTETLVSGSGGEEIVSAEMVESKTIIAQEEEETQAQFDDELGEVSCIEYDEQGNGVTVIRNENGDVLKKYDEQGKLLEEYIYINNELLKETIYDYEYEHYDFGNLKYTAVYDNNKITYEKELDSLGGYLKYKIYSYNLEGENGEGRISTYEVTSIYDVPEEKRSYVYNEQDECISQEVVYFDENGNKESGELREYAGELIQYITYYDSQSNIIKQRQYEYEVRTMRVSANGEKVTDQAGRWREIGANGEITEWSEWVWASTIDNYVYK